MRGIGLILLFTTGVSGVFAQKPTGVIVTNLFEYKNSIPTISWDGYAYSVPESQGGQDFSKFPQCLIRTNSSLFLALNGTGRLYKAQQQQNSIIFQRTDSTIYFGNNFDAFIFSYRDTIYSLGGYGFWKTNGLLRYFVEKRKEWEILKLNREVPVMLTNKYDLIWYDHLNGKIYFGFTKAENHTTNEEKSTQTLNYEAQVLDINKKEWQSLGHLSAFFRNDLTNLTNIASSPFGQMISFNKKTLYLNYSENRIYELSTEKQRIIDQFPSSSGSVNVCYYKDSVFYSGTNALNFLDSVLITKKDLVALNEVIFNPDESVTVSTKRNNEDVKNTIFIVTGILLIFGIFIYYYKRRTKDSEFKSGTPNTNRNTLEENIQAMSHSFFSEIEIETIRTVLGNSKKGLMTSIDEINKSLGVGKKNSEIQKKQRSDVILSINRKYSFIQKSDKELIQKKRTEFDKRTFEYFIDHAILPDIENLLKNNL